jgi:hypothetical protein
MSENKSDGQYEVISPWADVDPVPLRGISAPRLNEIDGKTIGLIYNFKPSARPILTAVETELKKRYPTCETVWNSPRTNVEEIKDEEKTEFENWVNSVDAVILAVGD